MPTSVLNVRINVDCRCELANRETAERHEFILGAPCKTELVGVERDIWMEPNADFCVVASTEEFLVLKSWARQGMDVAKHPQVSGLPLERQSGLCREAWAAFSINLQSVPGNAVRSIEDIIASTQSDRPLVARIQYDDGPWQVTIDHPVKTMNYSERDGVYQTDTGPILFPDLSAERLTRGGRLIDCFDLAYAAFNSAGWAEFIVNVPTPIGSGLSVNHYSKTRRIERTRNELMELIEERASTNWHVGAERGSLRVDGAKLAAKSNGAVNRKTAERPRERT
jgi:hypothetical protein